MLILGHTFVKKVGIRFCANEHKDTEGVLGRRVVALIALQCDAFQTIALAYADQFRMLT